MGTVTIAATPYTIYGTSALAATYWAGRLIGPLSTAWTAASVDQKASAQVMAYDILERQTYIEGADTFAERDVIQAFRDASYQLAAMMLADSATYTQETSGKNVKKVEAAVGLSVEFFAPTLGITGRFPTNIQELIGQYLAGTGSVSGSYASGTTDQVSAFGSDTYGINKGI